MFATKSYYGGAYEPSPLAQSIIRSQDFSKPIDEINQLIIQEIATNSKSVVTELIYKAISTGLLSRWTESDMLHDAVRAAIRSMQANN